MRRLSLLLCIVWCLALVPHASATGVSGTSTDTGTPIPTYGNSLPRFGVVDAYEAPRRARQIGATWERVDVYWNAVEPDRPGQNLPLNTMSDAQLADAKARGMTVVGLIADPPAWATRNGSTPTGLQYPYNDPRNQWARFVGSIVARYAGRIDRWIFWNEPDIPPDMQGTTWAGSDDEFYALMKSGYLAAKAANPNAMVIFPGTTYWADVMRNNTLFLARYLDLAQRDPTAAANGDYMDAVDLHVYSKPSDVYHIAMVYRQLLTQHGLQTPLMISEMNVVPTNDSREPWQAPYGATLDQQAAFMIQATVYAMAAGIRWISVYKMAEVNSAADGPYGLIRADGSPRPALAAYQTAITYLHTTPSLTLSQTSTAVRASFQSGGQDVTIAWARGQIPAVINIPVTGNSALQVDQSGAGQSVAVPLNGAPFTVTLLAATAPSDNGSVNDSRIGGDPVIFVQSGLGLGVRVSAALLVFPKTQLRVEAPFLTSFDAAGGTTVLGQPIGNQYEEHGVLVQKFANRWFRFHPEFKGSVYAVESIPAGGQFASPGNYGPLAPGAPVADSASQHYFSQTGHTVSGAFLTYFTTHGGTDILGYPRTEPFLENGRMVQWFQRARLEAHPHASSTPAAVQPWPIGTELTRGQNFPGVAPFPDTADFHYFGPSGHSVGLGFLHYYQAHDGLQNFGYPISQEMQETDAAGVTRTVQYFQYARFEYHPEFAGTPYVVELGLLGDQYLGLPR